MLQKQRIVVGRKVWIDQCHSLALPEGLTDGLKVKVLAYDPDAKTVTVEGTRNRQWTLDPVHIDTGWTFQLAGQSFAENTLQAKAYLKSLIAELKAQPDHPRFPDLRQDRITQLTAILKRNSRVMQGV